MVEKYNWKRFWHARGKRLTDLGSEESLMPQLFDWQLGDEFKRYPIEEVLEKRCLILLGEPGMGKSNELEQVYKTFDVSSVDDQKRLVLVKDYPLDTLKDFLREDVLVENWRTGNGELHLFIDALDEGTLHPRDIGNLIALYLKTLPKQALDRLYLRITCRTADWPSTLEETLTELFDENIGVYELAPLEYADVVATAVSQGVDPGKFWKEIELLNLRPLATKPITLFPLLHEFDESLENFPSSQVEVYQRLCSKLCTEYNPTHIERMADHDPGPQKRMNAAAQIATIMFFTNHIAIQIYDSPRNVTKNALTIPQLYSAAFEIDQSLVLQALTTGLFASRGEKCLGWAHQTYGEFLATFHANERLSLSQIRQLIFNPQDMKVIPQLKNVVAWLATMNEEVFRDVMQREPEILLQSDIVAADDASRAAMVTALLDFLNKGRSLNLGWRRYVIFRRLLHSGLIDQVRPYILDNTKHWLVREAAIEIVLECELAELQFDLVNTALDANSPHEVRKIAAYTVARIGNDDAKKKLKPLICGDASDLDDDLKGASLLAVWPKNITSMELMNALSLPKKPNYSGFYKMFWGEPIVEWLAPGDLPTALQWIKSNLDYLNDDPFSPGYGLLDFADGVVLKAWERLDKPEVMEAFVELAIAKSEQNQPLVGRERYMLSSHEDTKTADFKNDLLSNHQKRRQALEAALPRLVEYGSNVPGLGYETPLLTRDDLAWLVNIYRMSQTTEMKQLLLLLIQRVFFWRDYTHLEIMYEAMQDDPLLTDKFWSYYETDLRSEETQKRRENHQRSLQRKEERLAMTRPPLDPPVSERILRLLEKCENEDSRFWSNLSWVMLFNDDGTRHFDYEPEIRNLPGWQNADEDVRRRIFEAGMGFLSEQEPQYENWFSEESTYWHAISGYKALFTLARFLQNASVPVPCEILQKWVSIIVGYPTHINNIDSQSNHELVCLAFECASEETIRYLVDLIDCKDSRGNQYIFTYNLLAKFSNCWNENLSDALFGKLHDTNLTENSSNIILNWLIQHDYPYAIELAQTYIVSLPEDEKRLDRAINLAVLLFTQTNDLRWWPAVWSTIRENPEFGQKIVERVANDVYRHTGSLALRLPEAELTEFYLWLVEQYPFSKDPGKYGGTVTDRERVADWRDGLLRLLSQRGTPEALLNIERIEQSHPNVYQIQQAFQVVQNRVRQNTWIRPEPEQILAMLENNKIRLVQSGEQLLDVIIESLERLQTKLQGETYSAVDLWSIVEAQDICRPKDENAFSDYVKRHLEEDLKLRGIIAHREVEIRRKYGKGGASGEVPDIYVHAFVRDAHGKTYDSVVVLIESKGCWHDDVKTAMEIQLVKRYLTDNDCQYGLYLVGWFNCFQWDQGDNRRKKAFGLASTIEEARSYFEDQAAQLSGDNRQVRTVILNAALR